MGRLKEIKYEKGWLKRQLERAAKDYDSWPDYIKEALKLTTKEKDE